MVSINLRFVGKPPRLPSTWTSKTKKSYKRSTINGDIHLSKKISSNFDEIILLIIEKFIKAVYPLRFINSLNNEFQKCTYHGGENFIISPDLFRISIPYSILHEIKLKDFLKKFWKFVNDGFTVTIAGKTTNIRSLFLSKDQNDYKSSAKFKGDCSCGSWYTGETKNNTEVRWNEHNQTKSSEPSKHPLNNNDHCFTWISISNARTNGKTIKNLKNFEKLVLSRNGIT